MSHQFVNRTLALAGVLFALAASAMPAVAVEPPVTAVEFSPDGRSVVAGSQKGLIVRSWPQLKVLRGLETKLLHIHDVAFSPDGKMLAAAGGEPGSHGAVEVFSWLAGKRQYRVKTGDDTLHAICWRGDSTVWAAAGLDRTVMVHDARTGKQIRLLAGHSRGVTAVTFLQGGKSIVSAGLDQSVRVWNASRSRMIRTLDNHTRPVNDIALRPGGNPDALPMLVSVGEDRSVRLWQPTIGRMVRFTRLKSAVPLAVAWSIDGGRIIVSCTDGAVRIINPDTTAVEQTLPAIEGWAYSLAVHPDGREIVVAGQHGAIKRIELPPAASEKQVR